MNNKVIIYTLGSFLMFALLFASSIDKENLSKENIDASKSKLIIGDGAKVIIDSKASARFWYDEVKLIKEAKLLYALEEQKYVEYNNEIMKVEEVNEVTGLPTELTISKAFPNPFNPIVSIAYGLPSSSDVSILIYDLSGKKIMEYALQGQSAGWHEFKWNALDLSGQSIGSGLYLMTIRAGDMVKRQKITYLK